MCDFIIQFLVCNLFISILTGILLSVKRLFRKSLTSRMQYHLWVLFLGLLAVPFLPISTAINASIFFNLFHFQSISSSYQDTGIEAITTVSSSGGTNWMNDFSISVSSKTPSALIAFLCTLWVLGIIGMIGLILKSMFRFHALKKSALPLQNPQIHRLYQNCLTEMKITRTVPIYSAAFLNSPIIAGVFTPCIYLPIHLLSEHRPEEIRYMLLHELSHFKHKDSVVNIFMTIVGVLYWFNPFVWYALREMKNDREIACDTSVLNLLGMDACQDYGTTLINFAEKTSRSPFPFAAGISGSMAQVQKRILNIATYQPVSFRKKLQGFLAFGLIAILFSGFAPLLCISASDKDHYDWKEHGKNVQTLNLSHSFGHHSGSFVLYDTANDKWQIYNKNAALTRYSPVSTYKIYSALFALESERITPEQSSISWDGQHYPYALWNKDQTLTSAMQNSVTWYFQELDKQASLPTIREYVQRIGYGNQSIGRDISTYWIDSSLKISPVEQVELLKKFYDNQFDFSPENIEAVKDAICLSSSNTGTIYGKTGTKDVNGQNVSGWFIGFLEQDGNTYFFATNIQNEDLASGPLAADLTFSILSQLGLWN